MPSLMSRSLASILFASAVCWPILALSGVIATTEFEATGTITIENPSATESARFVYTPGGDVTLQATATGTGTSQASLTSSTLQTSGPSSSPPLSLTFSETVTAPPDEEISFSIAGGPFDFNIGPSETVVFTQSLSIFTEAIVPVAKGAASSVATASGLVEYFNDSLVDLIITSEGFAAENFYNLSLSGTTPPDASGYALVGADVLTMDGSRTQTFPSKFSFTLAAGETVAQGGGVLEVAANAAIPEPASIGLLTLGLLGLGVFGFASRRNKSQFYRGFSIVA
jgi:hypothetical protein